MRKREEENREKRRQELAAQGEAYRKAQTAERQRRKLIGMLKAAGMPRTEEGLGNAVPDTNQGPSHVLSTVDTLHKDDDDDEWARLAAEDTDEEDNADA